MKMGMVMTVVALALGVSTAAFAEDAKKEFAADKGPDKVDVSGYSKEIQSAYKVFAAKCGGKCHTLARGINTDFTDKEWKMYVKRMMNKPDSGISKPEGKQIYTFLKFYQAEKDKKKKAGKK